MIEWLVSVTPTIELLGWTLIHFLWQGMLLGLVFWACMRTFANAGPRVRYWIGMVMLVLSLAIPVATFVTLSQSPDSSGFSPAWVDRAGSAIGQVVSAEPQGFVEQSRAAFQAILPWVVAIWLLGVAFLSLRVAVGWRQLRRLATQGVKPLSGEWPARIEKLTTALRIRQSIRVLESSLVAVPTVMGFFKPIVLMPTACLMRLSTEQLELLIAHELGHVRRWDYVANLLQIFIETLLFYHPVVRWMSRRVRAEREQCCDDLVVVNCGRAMTYAKALTNLESLRAGLPAPALAATGGQLTSRIERLVLPRAEPRSRSGGGNFTVIALIAVVVIATARHTTSPVEKVVGLMPAADAVAEVAKESAVMEDVAKLTRISSVVEIPLPIAEMELTSARVLETPITVPATEVTKPEPMKAAPAATPVATAAETPVPDTELVISEATEVAVGDQLQLATVETVRRGVQTKPAVVKSPPLREVAINPTALSRTLARPPTPPTGPVATKRVAPEFPRRARVGGQQGYVELSFFVKPNGSVTDVRVVQSSPPRTFDRAAKRAMARWKFDPRTITARGERVTQRFDFALGNVVAAAKKESVDECHRMTGTRLCLPSG